MMIYAITLLSTLVGYILTVACSLAGTMALTSATPGLVVAHHRIRPGYKLLQQLIWLLSVTIGAFAASRVGMHASTTQQEAVLAGALLFVLWRNTWEARQRGTAHQILMTALTVLGVVLGFAVDARLTRS